MNNEKTWLTCREVGVLLNCSQRHALNLIKKNNISADRDERGQYFVHKSEFYRVFPEAMKVEQDGNEEKFGGSEAMKFLEEKIRHLQEMVDEKKKQNEFLTEQLGNFTEEKSKMLDAINSHTRLLEYKESGGNCSPSAEKKSFSWWPFKKS